MDYELSVYEMVLEGQDTVHAIKNNPNIKGALDSLKGAKLATKAGRKAHKIDPTTAKEKYKEAISLYDTAIGHMTKLKQEVHKLPEPAHFGQTFLSYLTPLFMWKFPRDELDSITPGMYYGSGGNMGMTMTLHYKTYTDSMSKATSSDVKKSLQERMNLAIKNTVTARDKVKTRLNTL